MAVYLPFHQMNADTQRHADLGSKLNENGNSGLAASFECTGVPPFVFVVDLPEPLKSQCSNLFKEDMLKQLARTSTMT